MMGKTNCIRLVHSQINQNPVTSLFATLDDQAFQQGKQKSFSSVSLSLPQREASFMSYDLL